MSRRVYRYEFAEELSLEQIEATLLLAIIGTESLHGESGVRLDAAHFFDKKHRQCIVDADGPIPRDLNRLFIGYLRREFGDDAFRVCRVDDPLKTAAFEMSN